MTDLEILRAIGKQIGNGKPLECPVCAEDKYGLGKQELLTYGDREEVLFCARCDMEIELTMKYRGLED